MRYSKFALLLIIVITLAGCGGGGGTTAIPTSNTTRQIQPGDHVTYTVTGTGRNMSTGQTGPVTGTMNLTVYTDTIAPTYGTRALKLTGELDLRVFGAPVLLTSDLYIEQDAVGMCFDMGTSDGTIVARLTSATAPPIDYPSPVSVGQTYSFSAQYSDGSSNTTSGTVLALEPANGWMAYRIHETSNGSDGTASSDEWFVPDLGYAVRSKGIIQNGESRLDLTLDLKSKNF